MATVKELNDAFRTTLDQNLGKVVMTSGVASLTDKQIEIYQKVKSFNDFNEDNDPHGEHDFGMFDIGRERFFWKIDYYDENLEYGSEDPADSSKTTRVLTIMLAEEY
jgi:hypothetical protein